MFPNIDSPPAEHFKSNHVALIKLMSDGNPHPMRHIHIRGWRAGHASSVGI